MRRNRAGSRRSSLTRRRCPPISATKAAKGRPAQGWLLETRSQPRTARVPIAKDVAPAKATRVLTNEDLPQGGLATDAQRDLKPYDAPEAVEAPVGNHDAQGEQWKSRIQSQKSVVASIQHEIDTVSESIHYAGANCVANCVQWNERQKQKQDQVEGLKSQLSEQQKHLEEMQESARKQGFGSSIYEP